ncbi:MAG: CotH kinase family protein [Lachnospiraceae bacterium]|nr:CotH kinase family protein [Lachnospiraceae bacterium]
MRKWLLALSGAGLLIVSLVCSLFIEENRMNIRVISADRAQKIEEMPVMQSEPMEFELKFAGEALAYDSAGKTFFLPVSMENTEWEKGSFEATGGAEILFSEDFTKEDKLSLLSQNRAIPFYAVSESGYAKYNLLLTGLPVLSFWGTEQVTENGEPLFEMSLYDTSHSGNWVTSCLTTSTLRGNTSLNYEKKSLRLKLKERTDDGSYKKENKNLLGIREDDDWILNSLYADNSRIRDKLAMELWHEVGAKENPYGKSFGVTGEYVEVLINGGYAGLYLLTHPVDRKQLGMDSVSSQTAAGADVVERIYKKKYSASWLEQDFVGDLPDPNQQDYRGGFYLKGDRILGNEEEWEPLRNLAACIEAEDEVFSAQIGDLADVSNILDNWLFFQAIAGFDNENKNVYYVSRSKDGEAYGYFIPWDMNICFGALYADNPYYCTETMKELRTIIAFQPGLRLVELDVDGSRNLVRNKWQLWRNETFATESICGRMDALMTQLVDSGAMQREMQRWPEGNADPDISFMKEFAKQRLEFLDNYVENL